MRATLPMCSRSTPSQSSPSHSSYCTHSRKNFLAFLLLQLRLQTTTLNLSCNWNDTFSDLAQITASLGFKLQALPSPKLCPC